MANNNAIIATTIAQIFEDIVSPVPCDRRVELTLDDLIEGFSETADQLGTYNGLVASETSVDVTVKDNVRTANSLSTVKSRLDIALFLKNHGNTKLTVPQICDTILKLCPTIDDVEFDFKLKFVCKTSDGKLAKYSCKRTKLEADAIPVYHTFEKVCRKAGIQIPALLGEIQ